MGSLMDSESPNMGGVGKEVKGRTHTYYQVLIDGRDSPYITHRTQNESVTFLGNHSENTRNLYAIPGLDYVAHEDILPYTTSETNPLQHELFDKFLMYQEDREPPYVAQDTLRAAREEPPLVGVVGRPQGDDREHPGDGDPLLHGPQAG